MDDPKCSKCGANLDRDTTEGTANWCKACRAKYQREYQATRAEMAEKKAKSEGRREGYGFGYQDAIETAASKFTAMGGRVMSAAEAAAIVRKVQLS